MDKRNMLLGILQVIEGYSHIGVLLKVSEMSDEELYALIISKISTKKK